MVDGVKGGGQIQQTQNIALISSQDKVVVYTFVTAISVLWC